MVRHNAVTLIVIGQWVEDNFDEEQSFVIHQDYISTVIDGEEKFFKIANILKDYCVFD